jgi:hypothetical protein
MPRQIPLLRTREQALGISAARLQASTNRSLTSLRTQIESLFRPWAEIDNSVSGALDDLLEAFEKFENIVANSVEWLKRPEGTE